MTFGEYLYMRLSSDAGVKAIANGRIHTEVLPQKRVVPAVVYTVVGDVPDVALSGPTGPRNVFVQVDSWARKRAEADALDACVRQLFDGHSGAAGGLEVQGMSVSASRWDFESDTELYRTSTDFEVWIS